MDNNATSLLSQSVLGIVVLALSGVTVKLYNRTVALQDRIQELQDLRLQDSKDISDKVTEVLQGNSQSNLILAEKIEVSKRGRE
jgi:ribosome maturation factor RimP